MGDRLATRDTGRKVGNLGVLRPFPWGAGSASNAMWPGPRPILHIKWHLDPSNRLATIHRRYRQTDRRTVLGRTVTCNGRPENLSVKILTQVQLSRPPRGNSLRKNTSYDVRMIKICPRVFTQPTLLPNPRNPMLYNALQSAGHR